MGVAAIFMEGCERRKDFEEESKRRVDARAGCLVRRECCCGFEQIAEAIAGNELGDDGQDAAAIAFYALDPREPLLLECRGEGNALSEKGLEGAKLWPQMQALEHRARFPVDLERATAQAVFVPGGRQRNRIQGRRF